MAQKTASSVDLTITGNLISKSTSSYMASKRCVHILVRGSLLNILCRRLNLDEPYLTTKYLDNTPIIRFKKTPTNPKNPIMKKYFQFLLGIKDAIEKNYLKEVYLYLKDSTGDILEAYKFKLKYNPEGDKLYETMPEPKEVKVQVVAFFEVIKSLGDIEKLKNDTYPELQLMYREDTPDEYEPPGFERCRSAPSLGGLGAVSALISSIHTGYHKLHCFGDHQLVEKLQEVYKDPDECNKKNISNNEYEVDTEEIDKGSESNKSNGKSGEIDNDSESNKNYEKSDILLETPPIRLGTPPIRKDKSRDSNKFNTSNITIMKNQSRGSNKFNTSNITIMKDQTRGSNKAKKNKFNTSNITVPESDDDPDIINITVSDGDEDSCLLK